MKRSIRFSALFIAMILLLGAIPFSASASDEAVTVTLNGETVTTDGVLDLRRDGTTLVFAKVTHTGGKTEFFYEETVISVAEGDRIETYYLTLYPVGTPQSRVTYRYGLRFVTEMNEAEFRAIAMHGDIKPSKIELGTVITPRELLEKAGSLEALGEDEFVKVKASRYRFYEENGARGTVRFAGSLWQMQKKNYNREFVGIGYASFTMDDGTVRTVYAADPIGAPSGTLARASVYQLYADGLDADQTRALELFKSAYNGQLEALYRPDLSELNVYYIGDEYLAGDWLQSMGEACRWSLTELSVAGATVSYDPSRTDVPSLYSALGARDDSGATAADVDLILLSGGLNDYALEVPTGTLGSGDTATYLGAYYRMTEELLNRYVNADIVFLTAWENDTVMRGDGVRRSDYTSSVADLYNKYYASNSRVHLADVGNAETSGINMTDPAFLAEYTREDDLLNEKGMKLMEDLMYPYLWERAVKRSMVGEKELDRMMRELDGLNVLALGDSLFSGNDLGLGVGGSRSGQWVNLLGANSSWSLTNLGIGGMTVSYTSNNYTTKGKKCSMYDWLFNGHNDYHWNAPSHRVYTKGTYDSQAYDANTACTYNKYFQIGQFEGKTNADVDLIILEGGCNDYGTEIAAPLGAVGDTSGGAFISAYHAVAQKLLADYPNAKLVFITTWQLNPQTRPDNLTSIEYSESVIDLYEQCYADNDRVFLIDAGDPNVSGINMLDNAFVEEYSRDRYHLKDNGMKVMADHMLPYLWQIIKQGKTV